MPGNIIVIAVEPDAGKTAFLLNLVRFNMNNFEIHYFSSEMGGSELKKRLSKFDLPLSDWRFKPWERSDNFADVIRPGKGKINVIDFLELHADFWSVGGKLADIHRKLRGAVAVIALQKNRDSDVGLGRFRGLDKARLYLAMERGRLRIVKAKNWATSKNPAGLEIRFKIADGCKFIQESGWHHEQ